MRTKCGCISNPGSPPQVRGKQNGKKKRTRLRGITPAGAGKASARTECRRLHRDHPRRCGENGAKSRHSTKRLGSPPQVRGKHCRCLVVIRLVRITPAGAGKTGIQFRTRTVDEDHPRRCGENDLRLVRGTYAIGSPPQVRGKLYCFACGVGGDGITPAGAGKTAVVKQAAAIAWDHPRRCGENAAVHHHAPAERGSPPQVRGKRNTEETAHVCARITPAGAGKTNT